VVLDIFRVLQISPMLITVFLLIFLAICTFSSLGEIFGLTPFFPLTVPPSTQPVSAPESTEVLTA